MKKNKKKHKNLKEKVLEYKNKVEPYTLEEMQTQEFCNSFFEMTQSHKKGNMSFIINKRIPDGVTPIMGIDGNGNNELMLFITESYKENNSCPN